MSKRRNTMIRRFALPLALGLVLSALVAPAALAKPVSSDITNGGYDAWAVGQIYKSTHPGTQNLGPLDAWAVGQIYKSTQQSTPVSVPQAGFASAAHAGRTGQLAPWERSFFHPNAAAPVNLGPLDPWAYAAIHKNDVTAPVVTTTTSSSDFSFTDAGIGAAMAFGVAVILLGTAVVSLRYRRSHRSGLATS
jgi:hypothetical protein